jgi:hypothetical protein
MPRAGGRKVKWFSLWTPLALKEFASVEIASASFEHSLDYQPWARE